LIELKFNKKISASLKKKIKEEKYEKHLDTLFKEAIQSENLENFEKKL
jgi:hypothetical protein